jgi:hypothetical protein
MGRNMYRFSIYHNRSPLGSGNVKLEGGWLPGIIVLKGNYIGADIGTSMENMTKSSTI